jgi:putative DNA primase/helicase
VSDPIAELDEARQKRSGKEAPPRAEDLAAFLQRKFPPRRWLMDRLIQERDAVMVHASRGVGKSRFVHSLGVAIASGGAFLRYTAPEPRGVLLVDGELPREELQAMLLEAVSAAPQEPTAPFRILAVDLLDRPLPSLATPQGQALVHANLEDCSLVILDNVSTLCASGPENESESWAPLQEWILKLRRRGLAVLLVHHDGKGGGQRGTSRREDILSQVVHLRRPSDYSPRAGAQFEVHLTKGRGVFGDDAEPYEASLRTDDRGRPVWTYSLLEDTLKRRVRDLHEDGLSQRDIGKELGIGLGTVNRKLSALRQEGELS